MSALLLLLAFPAFAGGPGTSTAQFLKIGAGARAAAMAEAQTALADDAYAAFYNPAGLARSQRPMLGAMHAQYFQGTKYEYAAFSLPIGRQSLGLSISNLGVDALERRTEDTDLAPSLFDASDIAYGLTYARVLTDRLALGATGKLVRTRIAEERGSAVAADLGLRYRLDHGRPLELGLAVRNLGPELKLADEKDPLPLALAAGAAMEPLAGLKVALDLVKYRDTNTLLALGAEYERPLVGGLSGALRAGYTSHRKDLEGTKGIALGAGLSMSSFSFDFAWVPFGELGNTFRYSFHVRF